MCGKPDGPLTVDTLPWFQFEGNRNIASLQLDG